MAELVNGGFEQEWGDGGTHRVLVFPVEGEPYETEVGNIFAPPGWTAWYRHGTPVAHDPGNAVGWAQPEVRDARAVNPKRMRSGTKGQLVFTFARIHDAGLMQQVRVTPGATVRFGAWAHAWSNHEDTAHPDLFPHPDDPRWSEGVGYGAFYALAGPEELSDAARNVTFYVGIDPLGGEDPFAESVVWGYGAHIYNVFDGVPAVEVEAEADTVTVFLRSRALWPFKHNDAYWDDCWLEVAPPPAIRPPREVYRRVYVLLHPGMRKWWPRMAAEAWGVGNTYTIGGSADDAGIMADVLDAWVLVVGAMRWGKGDDGRGLGGFFERWYPDAKVREVDHWLDEDGASHPVTSPAELAKALVLPLEDFPELLPLEPEPEPEPDPPPAVPAIYPAGAVGHVGVQVLGPPGQTAEFHSLLPPPTMKTVLVMGELRYAQAPILPVHRHWVPHQDGYKKLEPFWRDGQAVHFNSYQEAAEDWCDRFMPDLIVECRRWGLDRVWVESGNEMYDCDYSGNAMAAQFDAEVIKRVAAWDANTPDITFRTVFFTAAVGNPLLITDPGGLQQWTEIFLPLFRLAQDHEAVAGYHAYWAAHWGHPDWFERLGPYLQFRFEAFDAWLRGRGVQPYWMFTEVGPIGTTWDEANNPAMNAAAGWQTVYGDSDAGWARVEGEVLKFDQRCRELNAEWGGRIVGMHWYQVGSGDPAWTSFDPEAHLAPLGRAIRERYRG